MASFKPDVVVELAFQINPEKAVVKTNAKPKMLSELIEAYLWACQYQKGKDTREAANLPIFTIKLFFGIGTSPSGGDSWASEDDCNNDGLKAGILLRTMALAEQGLVEFKEL